MDKKERNHQYYLNSREKRKEYQREHYLENKE